MARFVLQSNHRLLGKNHASHCCGRGLILNRQSANYRWRDNKNRAERVGKATGTGAQLVVGPGRINLQITEARHAIARRRTDVQAGCALERTGSGGDPEGDRCAGANSDRRIVAEGILTLHHRLRA